MVTINAPLHPETEHLFDDELIARMKRGAYLINTARGKICDRDAVARGAARAASWRATPATSGSRSRRPSDHPWRTMPHHGMTPHTSGTSLSAQARYAAGTREILECWFDGPADPRGVPDRRRRQAGRRRRALLQRGRRDRRLRGGRPLQERLIDGVATMKMRAAVLEEFGEPLAVQEVELAEPRAGEVLVRLAACGVCHTDLYTASGADPSGYAPTVLGHEGAGVVEQVGPDVASLSPGRPRRHPLLAPVRRVRPLPRPAHQPLPGDPRAAEQGLPARRHDPDLPRRRRDPPLHGLLDLRRVHGDAGDRPGEGRPRGAVRARLPLRLRPLDRPRRGDQHRRGAAGQHLRRLRRRDGRPRRGRRLPPAGRRADRLRRPLRGAARAGPRPGRDRHDRAAARAPSRRSSR